MNSSIEISFKAKIKKIAEANGETPATIWQNLMLERFLVRLAQSQYRDHFILKGGLLLSKYLPIGRQTQDLDFCAKNLKNEEKILEDIFKHISLVRIDDGFDFRDIAIRPLEHPHMTYLGAQISMMGFFGKTRFKVEIDLGFGDCVNDIIQEIHLIKNLKEPLFEKSIRLRCYPREFIFAEKLETIIYRGKTNSRMKDFHDLYTMITEESWDLIELEQAVTMVFAHRKTPLNLPLLFQPDEIRTLERHWIPYHRGLNFKAIKQPLPTTLEELISCLNNWMKNKTNLTPNRS
jgi:predicted nucleotidyltransferase component of viral defense system